MNKREKEEKFDRILEERLKYYDEHKEFQGKENYWIYIGSMIHHKVFKTRWRLLTTVIINKLKRAHKLNVQ